MPRRAAFVLLAALVSGAAAAVAQSGQQVAGEWSCGGMRLYLTAAGGVELLGDRYRAGSYRLRGDSLAIVWDDGESVRWGYATSGGTLTLTLPGQGTVSCRRR